MKIKIVDAIMGAGKTSAAINYINSSDTSTKFLYITPYIREVGRIKMSCTSKKFKEPQIMGNKLNGIRYLLNKGENVVSTHALFRYFNKEIIDICRAQNYVLIMDEVAEVISEYEISKDDLETILEKYAYVDEKTKLIKWKDADYKGKFDEEHRLCDLDCLAMYGDSVMMWLFPISTFQAFRQIYVLTYMFDAQLQNYYYNYYGVSYEYWYVDGNDLNSYRFTKDIKHYENPTLDFRSLIHIEENEKLNMIGDTKYDLSKNWYARNSGNRAMKQLKNNLINWFCNIRKTKTTMNIWTCFKDYKAELRGKGYTRGFLSLNARSTNEYRDRTSVAYPVNRFLNSFVKNFFLQNNIEVNEDRYAVSEMLQFIWRSAIREGKEIWVYIPSSRMRSLLKEWIEENSRQSEAA